MKINCTESYVFFLARAYRARIQLSFTNTRGIQYSPYAILVSRLTGFQIWPSGRNTSTLMNIKIGILNVPKHCNKHDLIHFVKKNIFFYNAITQNNCFVEIWNLPVLVLKVTRVFTCPPPKVSAAHSPRVVSTGKTIEWLKKSFSAHNS